MLFMVDATGLPLRLPIHDVFKGKHGGLSVGGKLESGAVKVGSKVMVMPSHEVGTVKTLEVDGKVSPRKACWWLCSVS
jgi:elongation factor 1 alpha-like protein